MIHIDEMPLTFDLPLQMTVSKKEESSVTLKITGSEKTHFTCVLACTASGKKLPSIVFSKIITIGRFKRNALKSLRKRLFL